MQRRNALLLTLLGATLVLAGCGFQLRGTGGVSVPVEWKSMYLITSSPNSEFSREVKLRFDREGISIPFPQRDVHLYREDPA